MRPDMFKVLVERPRFGHSDRSITSGRERARFRGALDAPATAPMRPRPSTKYLSENFQPLLRFLARAIGRPWSKVYAEIAEHLSPKNAVQQHVRDHLEDFVELHARLVDGVLEPSPGRWRRDRFYVCPRSGLLEAWPRGRRPRRRFVPTPEVELVEPLRAIRRKHGVLFEVILAPLPEPARRLVTLDVLLGVSIAGHEAELARRIGKPGVYAVRERQLGKREIRRLPRHRS